MLIIQERFHLIPGQGDSRNDSSRNVVGPWAIFFLTIICYSFSVSCGAACLMANAFENPKTKRLSANDKKVESRPNVLIILVDDMGYGDPGCYNPNSKIPTPNIDALARQGMRFTDAHAPGALCHISRYGLMTGRYPWRTQVRWNNQNAIDENRLTVAGFLKSQGYRTNMVGKWHLGFKEDPEFAKELTGGPVDRGFDTFFGIRASTDIPPYFYIRNRKAVAPPTEKIQANQTDGWSPIQGEFWRGGGIAPDLELKDVLPRFTREAISVIENHAKTHSDDPMMLYLAYPAPHTPWLPAKEFIGKSKAGMYGDFATMVDANIGKVLRALKANGLEKNTLVIFTSDNGPVWYENDVERFKHDASGGLRGMKADAWECGHRMPFVVRWPDKIEAGTTSHKLICFTDLFATLGELLQAEIPVGQAPDSFSFLSALLSSKEGSEKASRKSLVIAAGRGHDSIRVGDWKLITGPGSGGFSKGPNRAGPGIPKGQLYNLKEDLGETNNLYEKMPDKVAELTQMLQKIKSTKR